MSNDIHKLLDWIRTYLFVRYEQDRSSSFIFVFFSLNFLGYPNFSEFNKKGIVLIYNDVNNRIGANCDSANLNHIFQRLPEFRDRYSHTTINHYINLTLSSLVLIENRNQLINPEESIESDIAHHLKNLSYGTDIQGMLSRHAIKLEPIIIFSHRRLLWLPWDE